MTQVTIKSIILRSVQISKSKINLDAWARRLRKKISSSLHSLFYEGACQGLAWFSSKRSIHIINEHIFYVRGLCEAKYENRKTNSEKYRLSLSSEALSSFTKSVDTYTTLSLITSDVRIFPVGYLDVRSIIPSTTVSLNCRLFCAILTL